MTDKELLDDLNVDVFKVYFLVHVRSLHLSTIPFVLVSNFPFVLTLTK